MSPICPCAIQLTSGERPVQDSTFSSSLVFAQRAKNTGSQQEKKTSERKKSRLAAGKIRIAAGKGCFRSGKKRQQKMPLRSGKNSKQQKKHLAAAQKHLCSRKNAFWRQRGKTVRGGKNPSEARKKPAEAGKELAAEKVQLCNPKSCCNGKKHFRNGKKQQPLPEMSRFIVQTGHTEFSLKCDCEPSTTSLAEAVRKACAGLRIVVHLEPTPTGDHQANGAAEAMVHVLRTKANLLVQQIEEATGCTKPVFGCLHPVYAWAVVHSSWLHNHFVVSKETTGYARSTGRLYSGKLALVLEKRCWVTSKLT